MNAPPRRHRLYRDSDADPGALADCTVALLGYGLLGRPLALNLRDALPPPAAARLVVGSDDDASSARAAADGFVPQSLAAAAAAADVALVMLPDEAQPELMPGLMAALRPAATLVFASGYVLAWDLVVPPAGIDVALFAPRMGGDAIRERTLSGRGYLSYVGVERDASGRAWPRLLALASACGSLRHGGLEMSARDEALLDLFVEQALGPWLGAAVLSAFHVGIEAGLPPLGLLLEMYLSGEMSETFAQMAADGFLRSTRAHGYAAAFGGMTRALAVDREQMATMMREVFADIDAGGFARSLQEEHATGYPCRPFLEQVVADEDLLNATEDEYRRLRGE